MSVLQRTAMKEETTCPSVPANKAEGRPYAGYRFSFWTLASNFLLPQKGNPAQRLTSSHFCFSSQPRLLAYCFIALSIVLYYTRSNLCCLCNPSRYGASFTRLHNQYLLCSEKFQIFICYFSRHNIPVFIDGKALEKFYKCF